MVQPDNSQGSSMQRLRQHCHLRLEGVEPHAAGHAVVAQELKVELIKVVGGGASIQVSIGVTGAEVEGGDHAVGTGDLGLDLGQ